MQMRELLTNMENAERPAFLYHGTTPRKAREIIANGLRLGRTGNTFGRSFSCADKPIGTRFYDKGAILVFRFRPEAKVLSLAEFQRKGRGDADAVIGGADGPYHEREIAIFNPACVELVGWYNKQTKRAEPDEPVYPEGFHHSWHDEN